jgi:hypothetical protein
VRVRSVRRWGGVWSAGGGAGVVSKGPVSPSESGRRAVRGAWAGVGCGAGWAWLAGPDLDPGGDCGADRLAVPRVVCALGGCGAAGPARLGPPGPVVPRPGVRRWRGGRVGQGGLARGWKDPGGVRGVAGFRRRSRVLVDAARLPRLVAPRSRPDDPGTRPLPTAPVGRHPGLLQARRAAPADLPAGTRAANGRPQELGLARPPRPAGHRAPSSAARWRWSGTISTPIRPRPCANASRHTTCSPSTGSRPTALPPRPQPGRRDLVTAAAQAGQHRVHRPRPPGQPSPPRPTRDPAPAPPVQRSTHRDRTSPRRRNTKTTSHIQAQWL